MPRLAFIRRELPKCRWSSTDDDDGHFLVRDQRAVISEAAEHVRAGLRERYVDRLHAILRQLGRRPLRRPRRIRTRARILPRLDLRRIERRPAAHRFTVDEPRSAQDPLTDSAQPRLETKHDTLGARNGTTTRMVHSRRWCE